MKNKDTEHTEDRELNQARSKADPVDWPVRTACTIVMVHNTVEFC